MVSVPLSPTLERGFIPSLSSHCSLYPLHPNVYAVEWLETAICHSLRQVEYTPLTGGGYCLEVSTWMVEPNYSHWRHYIHFSRMIYPCVDLTTSMDALGEPAEIEATMLEVGAYTLDGCIAWLVAKYAQLSPAR